MCSLGSPAIGCMEMAFLLRSRSDPFSRTIESSGRKTLSMSRNSLRFYLESLHVLCRCLSWHTSSVSRFLKFFLVEKKLGCFVGIFFRKEKYFLCEMSVLAADMTAHSERYCHLLDWRGATAEIIIVKVLLNVLYYCNGI